MKSYVNKLSQVSIISSVAFIVIGLFLLIKPATTLSMISYVIGIIILVSGIISLIKYFSNHDKVNVYDFGLVFGILNIIIAIVFISNPNMISSIIPLILGIWILVNGIIKLQFAINLRNQPKSNWGYSAIMSGINILLGLFLVFNPFKGAVVITRTIGGILVGYAIIDLLQYRQISKVMKDGIEFIK